MKQTTTTTTTTTIIIIIIVTITIIMLGMYIHQKKRQAKVNMCQYLIIQMEQKKK